MKQIPNLFTLLNLFFGCLAIVYILQNGLVTDEDNGVAYLELSHEMWLGSLCIAIAAVVDFLDGFVARLLKASSEMGKQLDSLADVVSFGVAPGMILYQLLRIALVRQPDALQTSVLWLMPAFVLPCAAAYRLAKFNLDTRQTYSFRGTPVPSVGLLVASLPLIYWTSGGTWAYSLLLNKWFLYAFIAVLSWLMVSDIPIMSNKPKDRTLTGLLPQLSLLVIAVVTAFVFGWLAVPFTFAAFVLLSVLFKKQLP